MKKSLACLMLLVVFLAACSSFSTPSAGGGSGVSTPIVMTAEVSTVVVSNGTVPPFPTPEPPTAIPTLTSGASVTELKYKVLDKYPDFFFCDPDFYPIARSDEGALAQQVFPELQANQEEFRAILAHNGLNGATTFTDAQKLLIYQQHKRLNAIHFELTGDMYQFQIQTGTESQQGSLVTGTIDSKGNIDVLKKEPGFLTCPICLAAGTLIDTPRGAVRVEDLQVGESVWTKNEAGQRVPGTILKTGSVPVPTSHQMIHVTLNDGRQLWASPGHPTSDGRRLGSLKIGDLLDGAQILTLERVSYGGTATFDILPSGDTGFYWANGILMGSTLKP